MQRIRRRRNYRNSRTQKPEKNENWFKENSTVIVSISSFLLVVITAYYAWQTFQLSETAQEQIKLNSEPQLIVYSEYRPILLQVKDSSISYSIKNLSYSNLTNITIHYKFYFHLIDSTDGEGFIEFYYSPSFDINNYISKLEQKSIQKVRFDLRSLYHYFSQDSGYYYYKSSLEGNGHWLKMNLRKKMGFMFMKMQFKYYREEDGKIFSKQFYFRFDSAPFIIENAILYLQNNIEEILSINRRFIHGIFERDDLF